MNSTRRDRLATVRGTPSKIATAQSAAMVFGLCRASDSGPSWCWLSHIYWPWTVVMNLNQVTVPSSDVARSIDFYGRLGLILIVEDLPQYARFECPNGDATFSVEKWEKHGAETGIVVYFECENVDSTVATLKERDLKIDSGPEDQPGSGEKHT